jgi:hypothetical protein
VDTLAAFAEAARDLRRHAGDPTKKWLVSSSGISRQALDDLLNGSRKPRWHTLVRYVEACRLRAGSAADPALFSLERWRDLHAAVDASAGGRTFTIGRPPELARAFQVRDTELAATGCHMLSGTGGVGKTQLARHAWDNFPAVVRIWVDGTSRHSIVSGYADAYAELVGAAVYDETEAAKQLIDWLTKTDRRWQVVIDDLKVPGDLDGLWPPGGHLAGRTILTTRRADDALNGPGRHLVTVNVFTPAESMIYLQERLAPAGLTDGAAELAEALDHLPLALAQATTFQLDRSLTCAGYRQRMAEEPLRALVPENGSRPDGQPASVVTTWAMSIDLADSLNPPGVARPVVEFLSVLDPMGVPKALMSTDPVCRHLGINAREAADGLHCLRRLSLVTHQDEPFREIAMLRVVHRVTREHLSAGQLAPISRAAADGLLELWPDEQSAQVAPSYLRTNAHALFDRCGEVLLSNTGHPLLRRFVADLGNSGDIAGAIDRCATLRALAETGLGPAHRNTLELRHDFVYWLGSSGERAAAHAQSADLVADCSRILGPLDELTLSARLYQARWVGMSGHAEAAVDELIDLIGDYRQALPADHPDLITARADRAHFTGAAGHPADAVAAYQDVVATWQRLNGAEHPYTLQNRNGEAFWTWKAGHVGAAKKKFDALVEDCLRLLGPFHRYTLGARGNLAQCRGDEGDTAAAVSGLESTLADVTQALGPAHPLADRTRVYLAEWRARQGDNV